MTEENKPRLVETGSGFSILQTVEYRGRFLYSKYSPDRSINSLIQKLELLPSTLVIINSPVLFYGLTALIQKLPDDCEILAVEDDANLLSLARDSLERLKSENPQIDFSCTALFSTSNLLELDGFIRKKINSGKIRRAVSLDFSAGKSFNPQIYSMIFSAAQEIIATFWKNRITLVKMGRLFSRNIFSNLHALDSELILNRVEKSVEKPILVCGAGESLDVSLDPSSPFYRPAMEGSLFIMAVDASLTAIMDRGINVDATVGLESQFAIQKAYIGSEGSETVFFADLCSRPQVQRMHKGRTVWFVSEFAENAFMDRIKSVLPDSIPPLGSVGLAAVHIALRLRKDASVPVFITGLDFSYSIGKTHAKNTPAHKSRLFSSDRLSQIDAIDAAFSPASSLVQGKDGKTYASSPVMISYRQIFENSFSRSENIFDAGACGLDLGIKKIDGRNAEGILNGFPGAQNPCDRRKTFAEKISELRTDSPHEKSAGTFLENEKKSLEKLRDLLSNGEKSIYMEKDSTLSEQIERLLYGREYLYLHFPDGYRLSMDPGFLKRIRAEIDSFLKMIDG